MHGQYMWVAGVNQQAEITTWGMWAITEWYHLSALKPKSLIHSNDNFGLKYTVLLNHFVLQNVRELSKINNTMEVINYVQKITTKET